MTRSVSTPVQEDAAYAALRRELQAAGLFAPDSWGYALHVAWVVPAYAAGWWLLLQPIGLPAHLLLVCATAFVMMQGAALGHEAGHLAVSRGARTNLWIGRLFMSLGSGSSQASWEEMHSAHHRHANSPRDPNLKARLFCFTEEDAREARGLQGWCTRHQSLLFWPLITLMGLSFRINSLRHMLKVPRGTRVEQALVFLHHVLWLAVPSLCIGFGAALANYLLILWACGAYLAAIFVANHLGHPAARRDGGSFMACQAGNTRNLKDNWLMRRFFVGLNSHIEHHLFPRISFTCLHRARAPTRRYCEALGIDYHEVSIVAAVAELHRHNSRMAAAARATTSHGDAPVDALTEGE
jgi:fatty acid desaturase